MPSPTFLSTVKRELLRIPFILFTSGIALLYFLFSLYILNYRLVVSTLFGNFPLSYKVTLLAALLGGAWTAFTPLDLTFILLDAILVGANTALFIKSIKKLRNQGMVEVSIGGATILGLVTAGCSSCGFSILALLGVSASFSFLPFKGIELHILATLLLAGSFVYMLVYLHQKVYCSLPSRKT